MTAKEWVELLVENASALRAAGVTSIRANGFEAEIAPEMPEASDSGWAHEHHGGGDPLDDPDTFGGHLPTYRRNEQ